MLFLSRFRFFRPFALKNFLPFPRALQPEPVAVVPARSLGT
jgi:hypothetical protein